MKKYLAMLLALCMIFALCACGAKAAAPAAEAAPAEAAPAEAAPVEAAPAEANFKLGMGIDVSTASTKEANAQVDSTVAAVVVDEAGVIVACRIDCAQNKMDVTAVDAAKTFLSKMELGDDYNMVKYSDAVAEWYDQAKAFESYVVGMTGEQVAAIETVKNEEGHDVATDEALLNAGCTISISAFQNAVAKACADDQGMAFATANPFTLGVACISTADESTAATAEEEGKVCMYTEFGAAVVGEDGTILAAVNDAIQPKIAYTADGQVGDVTFVATKRELKDDYNMVKFGNAIAEWYAQSEAFSKYCAGKTADEVKAIETVLNEEGHNVAVDETLFAECTMSIEGMMAVIAQAVAYAR